MDVTTPMPFDAAVARFRSKNPVASPLRTREWQEMALAMKERAFFSSTVTSIQTLSQLSSKIDESLSLGSREAGRAFMDRSRFIAEMRQELGAAPGDSGQLTDLGSAKRLGLIYDFQKEDAMEYGRWAAGQDPDILDAYPCQELKRVEEREDKRDWATRWTAAGGRFHGDRMIARKDDPVWSAISRFGRPWPPFDFGSGMGLEDVDRDEAVALGVIEEGTTVSPTLEDFNRGLEASVPNATPAVLEGFKEIFGDQVDVDLQGKVVWQGDLITNLMARAVEDKGYKAGFVLGGATPSVLQQRPDLAGYQLWLTADHMRHLRKEHPELTAFDLKLLPFVWREPDEIRVGGKRDRMEFQKEILGHRVLVEFQRQPTTKRSELSTYYIKGRSGRGP